MLTTPQVREEVFSYVAFFSELRTRHEAEKVSSQGLPDH